jgi:hypothetical protein
MKTTAIRLALIATLAAWASARSLAQEAAAPMPAVGKLDRGKGIIERPLKQAIVGLQAIERGAAPVAAVAEPAAPAVEAARPRELDVRKMVIQGPVKRAIARAVAPAGEEQPVAEAPAPPALRETKADIEGPVKQAIVKATDAGPPANPALEEEVLSAKDDNPKVAPGMVRWHDDFAAACKAAETSGKPVLLFQMLGQLDQRFT